MQLNELRRELMMLIGSPSPSRPPAIRRSRREEWLYASDIPGVCSEKELESIAKKLAAAGWETVQESGWLLLRKPATEPPEDWYTGPFGPEAACCLSLLNRHPKQDKGAEAVQRMLIKAGEKGAQAYENTCAKLHREWAAKLRKKESLPSISHRYFGI